MMRARARAGREGRVGVCCDDRDEKDGEGERGKETKNEGMKSVSESPAERMGRDSLWVE